MKKYIPRPIIILLKPAYYLLCDIKLFIRRKWTKIRSGIFHKRFRDGYAFDILCIKRTPYAEMAIKNVNSLHSLNPNHKFVIACDSICHDFLVSNKSRFDYHQNVEIVDRFGNATKPWQYYKVEVHIEASRNGHISVDADSIWHDDPIIDRNKITMLAEARHFSESRDEIKTLKNIFPKNESWLQFRHCVAAFLSMPTRFLTEELAAKMREINHAIYSNDLLFLDSDLKRNEARRLSEEFAVNIAIQSSHPSSELIVLKSEDGWGNKDIIQSLYFGCDNKIND